MEARLAHLSYRTGTVMTEPLAPNDLVIPDDHTPDHYPLALGVGQPLRVRPPR